MEIAIGLGIGVIIGAVIGAVIGKGSKKSGDFDDTQILNALGQYDRDTKMQLNNIVQSFADLKANMGLVNSNDKEIINGLNQISQKMSQNSMEIDKQVTETMSRSQNEFIRTLSALENSNLESQMKSMDAFKREISDKLNSFDVSQKGNADVNLRQLESIKETVQTNLNKISETNDKKLDEFVKTFTLMEQNNMISQTNSMDAFKREMGDKLISFEQTQKNNSDLNLKQLESVRQTVQQSLDNIAVTNAKKLDEMREVVDEKLQKTLEDRLQKSFNSVVEQLERVQNGLGEMQTLASDVGNLKKVLSNVKTRGILGEIQLGAILEEILSPEQYDTNVITVQGSNNPVEFAIKMPGVDEDGHIYLPIDSKFPMDTYQHLLDAYDTNDKELVATAWKQLENRLKSEAKDIREKYVHVPETTDFAIMFLPTEGLYAEAVRHGMVEVLQKEKIMIAGPTTMAALLNSLQMGFKTLAIQKSSSEVWEVLGHVKSEFETFEEALIKTQKHLRMVDSDLENLVGRRTRVMMRKLSKVSSIETDKSDVVLLSDEIENIE